MSLVKDFTILLSDKNSFKITFNAVYIGIAVIIPTIPKSKPPIMIIKNISKGWDFVVLENIRGWLAKLSIIWAIKYQNNIHKEVDNISI